MKTQTKEEMLFTLGGDCPGGIPFCLEDVWDISKDQFWGTVLLEIYSPDERHGKYWPQFAIRLVWQEMFRVAGKRPHIRARVARAEFKQSGYLDFSEEAVWVSQMSTEKLIRAVEALNVRLVERRAAWKPTQEELQSFATQDRALEEVCRTFRALSGPDEIHDVPVLGEAESSLEVENASLRARLEELEQRHSRLVEMVLRLR